MFSSNIKTEALERRLKLYRDGAAQAREMRNIDKLRLNGLKRGTLVFFLPGLTSHPIWTEKIPFKYVTSISDLNIKVATDEIDQLMLLGDQYLNSPCLQPDRSSAWTRYYLLEKGV
eukprot:m.164942 g.164942  ORF g.164942 m.164942 type:complete len:116 (-) comp31362_c0_seq3:2294-2641(-)